MKPYIIVFSASIGFLMLVGAGCAGSRPAPQSVPAGQSPAVSAPSVPPEDAAPASPQEIAAAEVAKHSTPDDCWFAINGMVYDVSGFAKKHPGREAVYAGCGRDATDLFETRPMGSGTPHSDRARSFLPNYEIGVYRP